MFRTRRDPSLSRRSADLWKVGKTSPESKEVVVVLSDILVSVKENIDLIERRQGKYSYDSALKTVQNLLRLKTELERIERAKSELKTLYKHLKLQAHAFNTYASGPGQARERFYALINGLNLILW